MKIKFDKPPALNHLYGTNNWGGKYLKTEGQMWMEKAMWQIRVINPRTLTGEVSLTIDLYTCRHQDNDSILKLLQDTLAHAGVYKDDYQIFELHVIKHKCKRNEERVEVEVLTLDK